MPEERNEFVKLKGIVTKEVIQSKNSSQYALDSGGKEYAIVSTGRQAIKDNLFVRKGQHMIVEGKKVPAKSEVLSKKSKIILKIE